MQITTFYIRLAIITSVVVWLSACATRATSDNDGDGSIGEPAPVLTEQSSVLKLLVIGGSSGIGLEVVKLALQRGHQVTAVSRRPERMTITHSALEKARGDITNITDMQRLLPGHDVVIMSVGLPAGSRNVTVFSEGIKNVLAVIQDSNMARIIAISAIGASDSKGHGGFVFDTLLQPFILSDDIADKSRMEQLLVSANLAYTIVRPAILTNDSPRTKYRVIKDLTGIKTGTIARQDVAHFILAAVEQQRYVRETVTLSN
jgi:putative NADH-flavin reductase